LPPILTSTNQDFLCVSFGDEINAAYGKLITLRAVRKTIAGRGSDTILISLPWTGRGALGPAPG